MKILYLGDNNPSSTSKHRANALQRLGHHVTVINPCDEFKIQLQNPILGRLHYYSGYKYLQNSVLNWMNALFVNSERFDIVWVNSGELFGIKSVLFLKEYSNYLILYNNDDPTGGRDGGRFKSLIKAIPYYDLCVVMRNQNKEEYYKIGAKKVLRLYMSYDEISHKPLDNRIEISEKFISDVVFIGRCMKYERRDEFMLTLINAGINVSIWGDNWGNCKNWDKIKQFYKGKSLLGRDYVAAIQGAKICIGLLSKGNRDQHTTRSLEIPFAGGLLCAERTSEHLELYNEGEDALFWDDAIECAKICKKILADDVLRERIRNNGMQKVRNLKLGNNDICEKIIAELYE